MVTGGLKNDVKSWEGTPSVRFAATSPGGPGEAKEGMGLVGVVSVGSCEQQVFPMHFSCDNIVFGGV